MMDREIGLKWVAALRSGEYKQSMLYLQDCLGFCCLGVLCDVHAKETGAGHWTHSDDSCGKVRSYITGNQIADDIPPANVLEWAGLIGLDVEVFNEDGEPRPIEFVTLNDQKGWSFAQIADAIEARLPAAA